MNWRYITTGVVVAATAAILLQSRESGGFAGLVRQVNVTLSQWADLDGYHPSVRKMDNCLRDFLNWQETLPLAVEDRPNYNNRFRCSVELAQPDSSTIAQAESWLSDQATGSLIWSLERADDMRMGDQSVFFDGTGVQLRPRGNIKRTLDQNQMSYQMGLLFVENRNFCAVQDEKMIFEIFVHYPELGQMPDICL